MINATHFSLRHQWWLLNQLILQGVQFVEGEIGLGKTGWKSVLFCHWGGIEWAHAEQVPVVDERVHGRGGQLRVQVSNVVVVVNADRSFVHVSWGKCGGWGSDKSCRLLIVLDAVVDWGGPWVELEVVVIFRGCGRGGSGVEILEKKIICWIDQIWKFWWKNLNIGPTVYLDRVPYFITN